MMASLLRLVCAFFLFGAGAGPLLAQAVPPASPETQARLAEFQKRIEAIAEALATRPRLNVWPKPITLEMRSCGEVDAKWTIETRRLHVCYEMAQEFSELYLPTVGIRNL